MKRTLKKTKTIELTKDQWEEQYKLYKNRIDPDASWQIDEDGGCLFETYGKELAYVQTQHARNVWTVIEGDTGGWYVVNGFHIVNRVGYLITRKKWPKGADIVVNVDM